MKMELSDVIDGVVCDEVEKDFFTLEAESTTWKYVLNTQEVFAITNICVLFRGPEEGVLSMLKCGSLVINGLVYDILTPVDEEEDMRVQEFKAVTRETPLPSFSKCEICVILTFNQAPLFNHDKIRIVGDVILQEQVPIRDIWCKYQSRLGKIAFNNGEFTVEGIKWSEEVAIDIVKKEIEYTEEEMDNDEEIEFSRLALSNPSHLDYIVEWYAQRNLLRKKLLSQRD
jgi:hypothetical protein